MLLSSLPTHIRCMRASFASLPSVFSSRSSLVSCPYARDLSWIRFPSARSRCPFSSSSSSSSSSQTTLSSSSSSSSTSGERRVNEKIRGAPRVRLVFDGKMNPEPVPFRVALARARERNLDLVEVSGGDIPVCKIMDFSLEKYRQQKRKAEVQRASRISARASTVKDVLLRESISEHDYSVKMSLIERILKQGYRCKVSVLATSRVFPFLPQDSPAFLLLERIFEDAKSMAKIDSLPRADSQRVFGLLSPIRE